MLDSEMVIEEMTQYLRTVLEKPHPVFGGLPICPFAQQARIHNKIKFFVHRFESKDLLDSSVLLTAIRQFNPTLHDVLFVIHPDKKAMSSSDLEQFVTALNHQLFPLHLTAFGGHPDDRFEIQGVQTRHDPYLNITVQSIAKLKRASELLTNTKYYDNWSPDNLKAVGYPH
jgi:hypothetical protein